MAEGYMLRPCPYDSLWSIAGVSRRQRWENRLRRRLEVCHPWGAAALALSRRDKYKAERLLRSWRKNGIEHDQLKEIADAPGYMFSNLDKRLEENTRNNPFPTRVRLLSLGIEVNDWQLHAWLESAGFEKTIVIENHQTTDPEARSWPLVVVQLEAIAPHTTGQEQISLLMELSHAHSVFDRDKARVQLLRRLGINSRLLSTSNKNTQSENWLDEDQADIAAIRLGLPQPKHLKKLGSIICLGRSNDNGWTSLARPPLMSLPGFDTIATPTWQEARALAAWIACVLKSETKLVRINPTGHENRKQGFACLSDLYGRMVYSFIDPIHPDELIREIEWRDQGCPSVELEDTPRPHCSVLWEYVAGGKDANATVCISLYNYEDTILRALESVKQQRDVVLDLIVVDDCSLDSGKEKTLLWMETNKDLFRRTMLIQHTNNGGLASARNTAFYNARTEWVFVLDADNLLHEDATKQCLEIASSDLEGLAVVHPFIDIYNKCDQASPDRLISHDSWQINKLMFANNIDAMALIRKSAWEEVGGYKHLADGWEDYEFWCNLVSHGYFGVVCPQVLATYCEHDQSMLRTKTIRSIRRTSRILQEHHPWLRLTTSAGKFEGGDSQ